MTSTVDLFELDITFNFEKVYYILDGPKLGRKMQETSKKAVLSQIEQEVKFWEEEIVELALKEIGLYIGRGGIIDLTKNSLKCVII